MYPKTDIAVEYQGDIAVVQWESGRGRAWLIAITPSSLWCDGVILCSPEWVAKAMEVAKEDGVRMTVPQGGVF